MGNFAYPTYYAHISVNTITKNRIQKSHFYIGFTFKICISIKMSPIGHYQVRRSNPVSYTVSATEPFV